MELESFDCAIIGGGPAGAALAITLAQWGRTVALIERGDRRPPFPEETIVPGAAPLLARLGAMAIMRAHGFAGPARHGVIWGDGLAVWRNHSELERGFKVERTAFDHDLRTIAQTLGATMFLGWTATGPLSESGEGTVHLRAADGARRDITAKVIVVAAGKTTGGALCSLELAQKLPPMVALGATVAHPNGAYDDATMIESVPEGWLWWLPLHDGTASLALFADTDEVRARGAAAVFREALRHSDGPAQGADLSPTFGLKATPRLLETRSNAILIGDAASAIDPLSSQGVEKALTSGEQAAVAVNTILEVPEVRREIVLHHRRWERALFFTHASRSLSFYRREVRFADRPFWKARHEAQKVEIESAPAGPPPSAFVRADHAVPRATFRRRGRLYDPTVGWASSDEDDVVLTLGGIEIHPLMEILATPRTVSEIFQLAAKDPRLALANERQVREALTELRRRGIIRAFDHSNEGDARGREDAFPKDPG